MPADDFDRHVVQPYVEAHRAGLTPNPCVECNRHIKFDKLFRRADALGFDLVATGHHARLVVDPYTDAAIGTDADAAIGTGTDAAPAPEPVWRIGRATDGAKDQSYVLHMLDQAQLRRLILPIGDLTKDAVRVRAAELGLGNATKPDSQDVCFIHSKGGREAFLGQRIPLAPARLVDTAGAPVGQVASVELVTIGQRRGLHLGGDDDRRYVVDIDRSAGVVTVGHREDLMTGCQPLDQLVWSHQPVSGPLRFQCSAHGAPRLGRLQGPMVLWDRPQPRVAAGQSIAIYRDEMVVGGAVAASVRVVPAPGAGR